MFYFTTQGFKQNPLYQWHLNVIFSQSYPRHTFFTDKTCFTTQKHTKSAFQGLRHMEIEQNACIAADTEQKNQAEA